MVSHKLPHSLASRASAVPQEDYFRKQSRRCRGGYVNLLAAYDCFCERSQDLERIFNLPG